jgi:phage terminase large subunit-like protein
MSRRKRNTKSPDIDHADNQDKPLNIKEILAIRNLPSKDRREIAEAGGYGLWTAVYFDLPDGPMILYPHQYEIMDAIVSPDGPKRINLREPRDHGKTETIIRPALAWLIAHDRDITILLANQSETGALKSLSVIKSELESNKRLIEDYGEFISPKWTGKSITVLRPHIQRDATVEAVGAGGSIVGGHFRLIIMDDIEDIDSARSETQRRHTREWYQSTLSPMCHPNGKVVNVATRKHFDDFTGHLDRDPTFYTIEHKAILEWPESWEMEYKRDAVGNLVIDSKGKPVIERCIVHGASKVLWPQRWPIEKLLVKFASMSENKRIFLMEYQNEVTDEELAFVKLAWLQAAQARGKDHGWYTQEEATARGWIVFQGWDLSLVDDKKAAENADSDWTAGITIGFDPATHDRYLMHMEHVRGLNQGQLGGIIRMEAANYPRRLAIMVERNAFGQLIFLGVKRTTDLPIFGHLTGGNKTDAYEGLPRISMLFENGKYILPGKGASPLVDVLISEIHGLGNEPHDDTMMALWICEQGIMGWIEKQAKRARSTTSVSYGGNGDGSGEHKQASSAS